jgi:hypothetical protein
MVPPSRTLSGDCEPDPPHHRDRLIFVGLAL